MTPAARDSVGEPPDRFYDYFAHRFPKLLMEVYEMVREAGWNEEVRFGKFFVHPWGGV